MENVSTIESDLAKSGLTVADVKARPLDQVERTACAVPATISGYVIPYFDFDGKPVPFYRARLFSGEIKYKQMRQSPNHVYFPPMFKRTLEAFSGKTICIVEGEKKAAALCKAGYPAIAFGGVDSWRTKALILPKETEFVKFNYNGEVIRANLPAGTEVEQFSGTTYAEGFEKLVEYALALHYTFMIIYDTDTVFGVKPEVQRAAATLGFELRNKGLALTQIKQLKLPMLSGMDKVGVDDFLEHEDGGAEEFADLFKTTMLNPRAFPSHPAIQDYIGKKLQRSKISRKDMHNIALALVVEMDTRGSRMYAHTQHKMFYFDRKTLRLMQAPVNESSSNVMQSSVFGKMLYNTYGVSAAADDRFFKWFNTVFSAEEPIMNVRPHRVLARPGMSDDAIRFQLSDGQYVRVDAQGIHLCNNGDDGFLFEADRVQPVDVKLLREEIKKQRAQPLRMWWLDVFADSRIADRGHHMKMMALHYYAAPWLYRWRNTQLPVEVVVGEAGSGKSTKQELRLMIQTGSPILKNAPKDVRDWNAAIANSGGLHVTDNVQLGDANFRATLSDELCRLITATQPTVEMRTLFTTADQTLIEVDNVFVFTAVRQPFMASDLLQRALIMQYDKSQMPDLTYDSHWKERKLQERGGREAWLAHHFLVLEQFFRQVEKHWDKFYRAQHRLINYEQIMMLMGKHVFGLEVDWLPAKLSNDVATAVSSADLALAGLQAFALEHSKQTTSKQQFYVKDIVEWAEDDDVYKDCALLRNSRKLGIYMATQKHMVHLVTGLQEAGKRANATVFTIDKTALAKAETLQIN